MRSACLILFVAAMICLQAVIVKAAPQSTPYVVCIDPGHPSEVSRGTTGRRITEMQAAWDVGLRLRAVLVARGFRVVMTKQREDEFVTNRHRAEIGNAANADYTIRLHCDANAGTGIASYAPNQQGVSDGVVGPSQNVIRMSQTMGRVFHATMVRSLRGALADRGFLPDTSTAVGGKHGALIGSIFSKVPVVLVEMCVLTNPRDEDFIIQPKNQDLLANAMADGIVAAINARNAELSDRTRQD